MSERKDFCISCRKNTEVILQKKKITKTIKDKEYDFMITAAVCEECGEEMSIPGIIDKNIQEIDEQYRSIEGIVSISDIKNLMQIYNIGKAPCSLALGFGEITLTRYLEGQIPSKEYSDVIRKALHSPAYMKELLQKNKEKIASAAYIKAMTAVLQLEELFSVSEKMLRVIAYIFQQLQEVTPLMLQKMLYFTQGIYFVLYHESLFAEDCEAWVHGPVYPNVYILFKDFKYDPIDDVRFTILGGTLDTLTEQEKHAVDLVVNTFGVFGGKTLERITHNEEPWRKARRGIGADIPSHELIPKDSIQKYYEFVNQKHSLDCEEGIMDYIDEILHLHEKSEIQK